MKLLITSGGTREAIDLVRYLSNGSTGKTGAAIATALVKRGHEVVLMHGVGAVQPSLGIETRSFLSTDDLGEQLRLELAGGDYDGVIMAAAVSDYRPESIAKGKLSSDADTLTLNLVRTSKILPQLRGFSPKPLKVIGFKLTVGADDGARTTAVDALFTRGGLDAVVQNDLEEMKASTSHPFRVYVTGQTARDYLGIPELSEALETLLQGHLS